MHRKDERSFHFATEASLLSKHFEYLIKVNVKDVFQNRNKISHASFIQFVYNSTEKHSLEMNERILPFISY